MKWHAHAAEHGNTGAQAVLGNRLKRERGAPQDDI